MLTAESEDERILKIGQHLPNTVMLHESSSENIQEHNYTTEFPRYSFPHPITFSPGATVAVAVRILWVGLSCQSIRGRFSRLAFLPLELSTNIDRH